MWVMVYREVLCAVFGVCGWCGSWQSADLVGPWGKLGGKCRRKHADGWVKRNINSSQSFRSQSVALFADFPVVLEVNDSMGETDLTPIVTCLFESCDLVCSRDFAFVFGKRPSFPEGKHSEALFSCVF